MKTFVFQIAAEPDPASPLTRGLDGAIATVWVLDKTAESAETRASHFITGYGWKSIDRPYVFEPTPQQIAELDPPEAEICRQALAYGIAARFEIWPPPDDSGCSAFQPFCPPPSKDV
ncbi:MAG: hypothetical protein R6X05_16185 [Desulfobacterales bacterium]